MFKDKKIIYSIISIIGIILVFFIYTKEDNISKLSLVSAQVGNTGNYEGPKNITFIEKLGLLYLSSGLIYEFGIPNEVVESGLQTILSTNLEEMDKTENEDQFVFTEDELLNYMEQENASSEETDIEDVESSENSTEVENTEQIIDWTQFYTKEEFTTKDSNGEIFREDDITIRYTTPVGLNKDNVAKSSNIWQFNYRYVDNALIGLETSYWTSDLFGDEEIFDRAWTSLKWISQDYLNCTIISDTNTSFSAIVYNTNSTYYWYLYLDKLYDYDAFGLGIKQNVLAMTVEPISIENAYNIMNGLGLLESQ